MEKAYNDMSCSDAARMLRGGGERVDFQSSGKMINGLKEYVSKIIIDFNKTVQELKKSIKRLKNHILFLNFNLIFIVGELESYGAERGWIVSKGRLAWKKEGGGEEGGVPSLELANMAISYAREMEQIV